MAIDPYVFLESGRYSWVHLTFAMSNYTYQYLMEIVVRDTGYGVSTSLEFIFLFVCHGHL